MKGKERREVPHNEKVVPRTCSPAATAFVVLVWSGSPSYTSDANTRHCNVVSQTVTIALRLDVTAELSKFHKCDVVGVKS
jgi:hypothetical protein